MKVGSLILQTRWPRNKCV